MSEPIITKKCSHCKEIKNVFDFFKNKTTKDGYQSFCKICFYTSTQKYRHTQKGRNASIKYRRSIKGYINQNKYYIKNKKECPEKYKARKAINNATRDGKLVKPKQHKCHYCNNQAEQYHHYLGYEPEHWFDVVPICHICHNIIHRINHQFEQS